MPSTSAISSGTWSAVFDWPIIGVHVILTPDNKILTYGTDQRGMQGGALIYDVWDPITNTHYTLENTTPTDLFCSVSALVPLTGEILISGGDTRPLGVINNGVSDVNVFNYADMSLSPSLTGDMAYQRWYPTAVTLANGKILMVGGKDGDGHGVGMPELYTPNVGWKSLSGAYSDEISAYWWYPRSFLNSDGKVVLFGVSNPNPGKYAVMMMDPSGNGTIQSVATLPFQTGSGMPAIMYAQDKVLVLGIDGTAWIMDISGDIPTFTQTSDVGGGRIWSNLVLLADGSVLISGGSEVNNSLIQDQLVGPSYDAAIWNPQTGEWTAGGEAGIARLYHSSTILLPDATVLSVGGGAPGPLTNTNGEIYTPFYLYDEDGNLAPRPIIIESPDEIEQRQPFLISVDDAADISRLTFIKAGSVTHALNMTTTKIDLQFTVGPNNTIQVDIPENANVLTPGQWMLFAFNSKGTPSVAATIQVGLGGEMYSDAYQAFLTLNGSALYDPETDTFTLTADSPWQSGAVMGNEKVDLRYDFSLTFSANFGTKDATGSDGITFLLHNDPFGGDATGRGGGEFGALGIRNGVGVEFDTWRNPQGDISDDHTNFLDTDAERAHVNLSSPVSLGNIEDGLWHDVKVAWDASGQTLRYWVDGTLVGALQQDIIHKYLGGSSLAYFGFTGATGAASNLQQIKLGSFDGQLSSDLSDGSDFDPTKLIEQVSFNGDTSYSPQTGVITLTPDVGWMRGGVTFNEQLDLTQDFHLVFQANFGPNDKGSDGMAFVLHNDPRGAVALGGLGGMLGATGIINGLGIEFDIWRNPFGDILDDHTNFIDTDATSATRNVTSPVSIGNVENGAWHSVIVDWDAETQTLQYWVDGALAGTLQKDIANEFLGGSSQAHLALTGATGGASNLQQVRLVSFDGQYSPTPAYDTSIDPTSLSDRVTINGNSGYSSDDGIITLTPDSNWMRGSVAFNERIDLGQDFSLVFHAYFGSSDAGADGISFVLHNDPRGASAVGDWGGNLGLIGIVNGIAIEFDTWRNPQGDIITDHTNFIDTDADKNFRNITNPVSLGNIEDGNWHEVIIDWDASSQTLRYWIDNQHAGTLTGDISTDYLSGSHYAYLGFTGATGGSSNLQQIVISNLEAAFEPQSSNAPSNTASDSQAHLTSLDFNI